MKRLTTPPNLKWPGKNEFLRSMKKPFSKEEKVTTRSAVNSEIEKRPEVIIKRIVPQIKEVYSVIGNNIVYITTEEWDNFFKSLGGGQSRRTSSAILKRMTWEQFIEECKKVCEISD